MTGKQNEIAISDVPILHVTVTFVRPRDRVLRSGFAPSGENYHKAISILKERYGDPSKLASHHYQKLEKLPSSENASTQRATYDEICKILANLSALGTSIDEDYLRERILQKFCRNTLEWVWAALRLRLSKSQLYLIERIQTRGLRPKRLC